MDSLDVLLWASIILSLVLMIISLMSVGKHASELQYQKARKLNGIRWIQSWINLRIQGNRVFFALAFCVTSIIGIVEVEFLLRSWIGRSLFFGVLIAFTVSAAMDWMAEAKQLKILLEFEDVNNI